MAKEGVSITLDETILEQARQKAENDRRSLSAYIEMLLDEDLKNDDDVAIVTE